MPIQGQRKTTFIQGNFLTLFKFPTFSVQKKPHLSDSLSFVLLGFVLSVTQRKSSVIQIYTSRCSSWNICCPQITECQTAAKWGWSQHNQRDRLWGIQAAITQTLLPTQHDRCDGLNTGFGLSWTPPVLLSLIMQQKTQLCHAVSVAWWGSTRHLKGVDAWLTIIY